MKCHESHIALEELLDGQIDAPARGALEQHLTQCASCRARLEREKALRTALRNLPVPVPRSGFTEQALRHAAAQPPRHGGRRHRPGLALAASLVVGIAVGVLLFDSPATGPGDSAVAGVTMMVEQPQQVHLAFDTETPLENVSVTLRLPEQIELVGYPGQRQLQWRTDLVSGRNRLNLPIIAHGGAGGVLVAELAHERGNKQFEVRIRVAPDRGVMRRTQEPVTRI